MGLLPHFLVWYYLFPFSFSEFERAATAAALQPAVFVEMQVPAHSMVNLPILVL